MFADPSPKLGDSDNNLLFKIAQSLADSASGGGGLTQALADGRYVNVAGDSMTGPLDIATGTIVADAPAFEISQTWNNGAVAFSGLLVNVTATASDENNSGLIRVQEGGSDRFRVDPSGRTYITRQEADTAGIILELRKRGTTGDATAPVASGDLIARLDWRGWNGASFAGGAAILGQAAETYTAIANGSRLLFQVAAPGAVPALTRATLNYNAFDLAAGTAYFLGGVALFNAKSVYAAGTAYTLTNVSAAVDFGTTDPIITLNAAGTYKIKGRVKVNLNGATFAANQTLTVKLRRTNNTAADVSNSSTTWTTPIVTTITNTLAVIELPEVFYTTANTDDTIQLFADISVVPSAGTITIAEASITAIRTA